MTLAPRLAPRYFVGVESRTTVLTGLDVDRVYRPDVTIHADGVAEPAVAEPAWRCSSDPRSNRSQVVVPVGEEIEETFLAIQELPGRKLVTVIEVLSPTNKKTDDGRTDYLKKRDDLIQSRRQFRGDRPVARRASRCRSNPRLRRPTTAS